MVGWTDLPADLSDRAALVRLEAALPDAPVISSDLIRAVATADAVQGHRQRLPHDRRLREFHYGAWEDKAFDEIESAALRRYFEDPGVHRAPGGESWNDVSARVATAVNALDGAKDVIVVAHMGVVLTLWARALGVRPYRALAQKIDNLSLTRVDWHAQDAWPVWANRRP